MAGPFHPAVLACLWGIAVAVQVARIAPGAVSGVLGGAIFGAALMLAGWSARLRACAELLRTGAALDLDEALSPGAPSGAVLLTGRIGASGQVTSPGGVVGAFYQAQVRALSPGRRGALLSMERAQAEAVFLRGERSEVAIERRRFTLLGGLHARRCRVGGRVAFALAPALAEGTPSVDAVSYERVGKLGERCWVLGRIVPGRSGPLLRSAFGRSVVVVLSGEPRVAGEALARSARVAFLGAATLGAASAFWIARLS